jgi:hypothetical protein
VKHHDIEVMLTKFHALKPWFVKKLHEWNTCCHYHTEIYELKERSNNIKSSRKGVHGHCNCSCVEVCHPIGVDIGPTRECQAHLNYFQKLVSLWPSILCPKDAFAMFHERKCLFGTRSNYGVQNMKICSSKLNSNKLVAWRKIAHVVVGRISDG